MQEHLEEEAKGGVHGESYTVVARRYRPKNFAELIGQDHIAQALNRAIQTGRVGHAYLFTGARGVGKTSTARIFAKTLNISEDTPAELATEIAHAIDTGEDIDVIEIDGASNRGIEEIRQLRANVNVRPSRSRFKIYIIDEVHMLTNQAFNALLKTLEEPPPHVKFIFCTTDPEKIPITVLSRCQRFDFAPVQLEAIQGRLKEICASEGYEADEEALALLARRAAGSMRDSQSLLEQVMSFSVDRISADQVHDLLGTADESRLQGFVQCLIKPDRLEAMRLADEAIRGGADAGQLAEQLLAYLRDLMVVAIGGGPELLKLANPASHSRLKELAESWGLHTILAAVQLLDESLVRMRSSISSVTLLEVALVQICDLDKIASIPELLERLQSGSAASPAPQKKNASSREPLTANHAPQRDAKASSQHSASAGSSSSPPTMAVAEGNGAVASDGSSTGNGPVQGPENVEDLARGDLAAKVETRPKDASAIPTEPAATGSASPTSSPSASVGSQGGASHTLQQWKQAMATIDGMLADIACVAESVEALDSSHWRITFPAGSSQPQDFCEQPEKKAELIRALQGHLGRAISLSFDTRQGEARRQPVVRTSQSALRAQRMREISNDPYVKRLCEVLEGEIMRVDPPKNGLAQAPSANGNSNPSAI